MNVNLKSYKLRSNIDIYYSWRFSILFMRNPLGSVSLYLPSYHFIKKEQINKISLAFINKRYFSNFLAHIFTLYNRLFNSYYVKIKIRGLGYRIREIADNFHYFFFNYTNYYYLHSPNNIFISIYKKRVLIISLNWQSLKLLLSEILLLKFLGPYRLRGWRIPRQFVLLKKSGKTI